jgi:hypothetical protein
MISLLSKKPLTRFPNTSCKSPEQENKQAAQLWNGSRANVGAHPKLCKHGHQQSAGKRKQEQPLPHHVQQDCRSKSHHIQAPTTTSTKDTSARSFSPH